MQRFYIVFPPQQATWVGRVYVRGMDGRMRSQCFDSWTCPCYFAIWYSSWMGRWVLGSWKDLKLIYTELWWSGGALYCMLHMLNALVTAPPWAHTPNLPVGLNSTFSSLGAEIVVALALPVLACPYSHWLPWQSPLKSPCFWVLDEYQTLHCAVPPSFKDIWSISFGKTSQDFNIPM